MAKDDYEVVAYRILVYLYAIMKRKIVFNEQVFQKMVLKDAVGEEYLASILHMMLEEGLITGVTLTKAWGNNYLISSELSDAEITAAGIHHLKKNPEIRESIIKAAESIATLIIQLKLGT